jgi:hypothetical protein
LSLFCFFKALFRDIFFSKHFWRRVLNEFRSQWPGIPFVVSLRVTSGWLCRDFAL